MNKSRTVVADPETLEDTDPPEEIDIRCPEYPETHTRVELREGYFHCEECECRNEHPRYQSIYDRSRDALIARYDFLEQWGPHAFAGTARPGLNTALLAVSVAADDVFVAHVPALGHHLVDLLTHRRLYEIPIFSY